MTRTRRLAILWIAFLLVALPSLFLWMLLGTTMGLRYALKQAAAALPEAQIEYARADGSLWRGARIEGLRVSAGGAGIEIATLEIAADLRPLLRGRLLIERVAVRDLAWRLPEAESAAHGSDPFPLDLPALDLPLAVSLREAHVDRLIVSRADEVLVDGSLAVLRTDLERGRLDIGRVTATTGALDLALRGSVDSRRRWRSELNLEVVPERPDMAFEVAVGGDFDELGLQSRGSAALPLRVQLAVRGLDRAEPQWRLDLSADGLDPGVLMEEWEYGPIDVDLHLQGALAGLVLAGHVGVMQRKIELETVEARWSGDTIELPRIALRDGAQTLRGRAAFDLGADIAGRLDLDVDDLQFSLDGVETRVDARLSAAGSLASWTVELHGDVHVADDSSRLVLVGRGGGEGIELEHVEADHASGRMTAQGRVEWLPQPSWDLNVALNAFDPERFGLPWPARLDARGETRGRWDGASLREAYMQLTAIEGTLRGAPVAGEVTAQLDGGRGRFDALLRLGDGQLLARGAAQDERVEAQVDIQAFDSAALGWPWVGRLDGRIGVAGPLSAPEVDLDLSALDLRLDSIAAAAADLEGRIAPGQSLDLRLEARDLYLAEQGWGRMHANLSGSLERHRIDLELADGPADLEASAAGRLFDGGWQGELLTMALAVAGAGRWQLETPSALAWGSDGLELGETCLDGAAGHVCVRARLPSEGDAELAADIQAVPLALLSPFLFADGMRHLEGVAAGRAQATRRAGEWRGEGQLRVPTLTLSLDPGAADEADLRLHALTLQGGIEAQRGEARLLARVGDDGQLELAVMRVDGMLDGSLTLDADVALLAPLLPGLDGLEGRLVGTARLVGTLEQPALTTRLGLTGFAADVPAAGIRLRTGRVEAHGEGGALEVEGEVASGDGRITLDGQLDLQQRSLVLRLSGTDFELADLPLARLVVSPNLSLQMSDGAMRLSGGLEVPSALIDISRLESADRPSADVRILEGGVAPAAAPDLPLRARVTVTLGDDVRLRGFGLDGRLGGALTVRETPGQSSRGEGSIDVSGRFVAYGRQLDIQRGRLLFNGALDNPLIDVRAERAIDEVTVGVQAVGEAVAPQLTLFSRPPMSQSDVLAYLVVGRPMSQVRGGEGELLTDAASALGTAGGDLLARQLGARVGLDLGVSASDELGTALTVGKFLSPRLYLGYGVSLFGSGQAVLLRYLISEHWSAEVESGAEGKAALNYRLER